MFTQEEYMDVLGMRSQGWSIAEIARETNYHPATWNRLKSGGPPPKRSSGDRRDDARGRRGLACP